jgi:hypothetical protein
VPGDIIKVDYLKSYRIEERTTPALKTAPPLLCKKGSLGNQKGKRKTFCLSFWRAQLRRD